jgi:hypothetical protein
MRHEHTTSLERCEIHGEIARDELGGGMLSTPLAATSRSSSTRLLTYVPFASGRERVTMSLQDGQIQLTGHGRVSARAVRVHLPTAALMPSGSAERSLADSKLEADGQHTGHMCVAAP